MLSNKQTKRLHKGYIDFKKNRYSMGVFKNSSTFPGYKEKDGLTLFKKLK